MGDTIESLFVEAGCSGALCVVDANGHSVEVAADRPVVAASLIKVLVAVEVESEIAAGRLDATTRVVLPSSPRTPGPTGFSLYLDPVEVSLRDLEVAMLTISDNVATDALIAQVGLAACNAKAAELGLTGTTVVCDIGTAVNQIGQAAGFADYPSLVQWSTEQHSAAELAEVDQRAGTAPSLLAQTATVTTARDMVTLLQSIWSDRATSADGCWRIRTLMGKQLTRHRLASGFPASVRVSAKSGGLAGVYRHEAGVIEYGDGRRYFAAVLTEARDGPASDKAVNTMIGTAASHAIKALSQNQL